jgi:lipopolysaccharide export system protein LptC
MSDRFGGWFPLLLLAVLAAVTFWLDRIVQPFAGSRVDLSSDEPGYIVDGLSAVRMDSRGRVQHTLRAQKMTHYPDKDMTLLVEPKFVTFGDGHAPVTVTSRNALMYGNGDNVIFENQVRVVRAPYANRTELVVETSYLQVIPDANVAKTDKPVTIRDATGVVSASGLELNSETRFLKLEGRVKGTFDGRNAR